MTRKIDGINQNNENQDGINLRAGCHDVIISDITGTTGDDVIALTAIASSGRRRPGGSLKQTEIMANDFSRRDKDIRNVIIRNVPAADGGIPHTASFSDGLNEEKSKTFRRYARQ